MAIKKCGFIFAGVWLTLTATANQPFVVVLDWLINSNHAPLMIAAQRGYFRDQGLDVQWVTPTNPADPPKWVAAKRADLALDYQPSYILARARGLPLTQVGTLLEGPLSCIVVLAESAIKKPEDFRGKRIASAINGVESEMIATLLARGHLRLQDVVLVNTNYNVLQALLTRRVDAASGLMRNVELIQLDRMGQKYRAFYPENYGFPPYDELIFIARPERIKDPRFSKFFNAIQHAGQDIQADPEGTWREFAQAHPELNNALNHHIWLATLPHFAKNFKTVNQQKNQGLVKFFK